MKLPGKLYYSEADQTLFWISGYCASMQTSKAVELVEDMLHCARRFSFISGAAVDQVQTKFISESASHAGMRVFYVKLENLPPYGERITRTMDEFLRC